MKAILLSAFLLAGCSASPARPPAPVEYKTAVPTPCIDAAPVRPTYETETLPETTPDGTLAIALARDWGRSRLYEGQLERAVEGCK